MKISQLLFVNECAVCKREIRFGAVCPLCTCKLRELVKFDSRLECDGKQSIPCHFAFRYKDNEPVKNFIFTLKEQATKQVFELCSKIYLAICQKLDIDGQKTVITYVPRSRKNLYKYGYDQSKECARLVAKKSDGKFEFCSLIKRKYTSIEQKYLNREQRKLNTSNKFAVKRCAKNVKPDTIIILDDVVTTANSVKECAKVLRNVYGEDVKIYGVFLAAN